MINDTDRILDMHGSGCAKCVQNLYKHCYLTIRHNSGLFKVMKVMTLNMSKCSVCGKKHGMFKCLPAFEDSAMSLDKDFTHWGVCPQTNKILFIKISGESTEEVKVE